MFKSLSKLSLAAVALASLPLTACFDDNYDLSDIDTNIEVKVKDLVVPVNLDDIELTSIFDLNDESVIKELNGEYTVLVDGDFKSEEIKINAVTIGRPSIPATTTSISLLGNGVGDIDIPTTNIGENAFTYEVAAVNTTFDYSTNTVDKSIRNITKVAVDWTLEIKLTVQNSGNVFNSIAFRNVTLQLPKGLHTPDYVSNDGQIKLEDINLSQGHMTHSVTIHVDEIDAAKLGDDFSFTAYDDANGHLSIHGEIGIVGGYVVAVTNNEITKVPASTSLTLAPVGTDININAVDGEILYSITDFNVDPVTLNDLPDFLMDDNTEITIANPRLYLSINNPMAGYGLNAFSGLTLTSCRKDGVRTPYSLDANQLITIEANKGVAGPYNFCIAPEPTAAGGLSDFPSPSPVYYHGLSNVLGGKGLPEKIEVSFDDPRVGPGTVTNFTIPQTLQKIEGRYSFFAPLNLGVGSTIMYEEEETGWNDETVEKIVVEKLVVEATVTNSLPFDIILSGYPVDVNGRHCVDKNTNKPITLEATTVKAGETSPLKIECNGTIQGLDGIHYCAKCNVTQAGVALRPDATIRLSGIKARVSGHYIDEL